MKKFMLILFCLCTIIQVQTYAIQIETFTLFWGDRHSNFQGDTVVYLEDSSGWKVHPKDTKIVQHWNIGDNIYLYKRDKGYWFKREHHFRLINTTRGEEVRGMLVDKGPYTHTIVDVSTTYPSDVEMEPVYGSDGKTVEYYREKPVGHQKDLLLSDGTRLVVKKEDSTLCTKGTEVYVIRYTENETLLVFSDQRDVKFTWTKRY